MIKKVLKIKPNDMMFFRDGRPFGIDENQWHDTRLIPYPSVFYGALVSSLMAKEDEIKEKIISEKNEESLEELLKRILRIESVFIIDQERKVKYVTAPRDVYKYKSNYELGKWEYHEDANCYVNLSPEKEDIEECIEYFVDEKKMKKNYNKSSAKLGQIAYQDVFKKISRTGISIDRKNKTAEDGKLYMIEMAAFQSERYAFGVEISIDKKYSKTFVEPRMICLGGEGKSALCIEEKDQGIKKDGMEINKSGRVKLVFKTPAIVEGNMIPDFGETKVIGQAIGKIDLVGGFDIKKNIPKKMMRAIPSGSVLILENKKFKEKALVEIESILDAYDKQFVDGSKGFGKYSLYNWEVLI